MASRRSQNEFRTWFLVKTRVFQYYNCWKRRNFFLSIFSRFLARKSILGMCCWNGAFFVTNTLLYFVRTCTVWNLRCSLVTYIRNSTSVFEPPNLSGWVSHATFRDFRCICTFREVKIGEKSFQKLHITMVEAYITTVDGPLSKKTFRKDRIWIS